MKTVEESASISGFYTHNHIKGRERHLLVETLGLPLCVYMTSADGHDTLGARRPLAGLAPLGPRLKKIWADGAYRGQALSNWCRTEGDWTLEVVERGPLYVASAFNHADGWSVHLVGSPVLAA